MISIRPVTIAEKRYYKGFWTYKGDTQPQSSVLKTEEAILEWAKFKIDEFLGDAK
jgi:hypothetical protein